MKAILCSSVIQLLSRPVVHNSTPFYSYLKSSLPCGSVPSGIPPDVVEKGNKINY